MDYNTDFIAIYQLFQAQVHKHPNKKAIIFDNFNLSYLQLESQSNCLAHYLARLGVTSNIPIALFLERGFNMVIGLLGVLKAGAAYVPIAPNYPPERIKYILEDSQSSIVITQGSLFKIIKHCIEKYKINCQVINIDEVLETLSIHEKASSYDVDPNDLAYIIYTSGSTGQPKGVQVYHHSVRNILDSMIKH